MKRLSIALAAIGLSASAFAALPAAQQPSVVNVPQLSGGFFAGLTGYYLQPTDSNGALDYASVNTSNIAGTVGSFGSTVKNVKPGYDWGWGAKVGYDIPGTANDISVNYFRLSTDDTAATAVPVFSANTITTPAQTDAAYANANAKAEYDLNQVDLTAGQLINVGCRTRAHAYAGLRWADVDSKLNSNFNNPVFFSDNLNVNEKSDFEGIGPIAGLDASYYIGMGFGVVAHADSALLIGNINSSTTTSDLSDDTLTNTTITANNARRIVPVVDGKLAGDYTYMFLQGNNNSSLSLEAGWQVSQYYNAVDQVNAADHNTSDLGLSGPYVSLTFHA